MISEADEGRTSSWILNGVCSLLLLVGVVGSWSFGRGLGRSFEAQWWTEVPCEIVSSGVTADGGVYELAISYRYEIDGVAYTSSRYEFLRGASSLRRWRDEAVRELPPGTVAACWVDPDNPAEAVLYRGLSPDYLFALIPLAFAAFGIGCFVLVGWIRRGSWPGTARPDDELSFRSLEARAEPSSSGEPALDGPRTLEAPFGSLTKLIQAFIVAALWNGFVGVFVFLFFKNSSGGWDTLVPALLLLPFVLIGLLLLSGIPYHFLALANPRVVLSLSRGAPRQGESVDLSWEFKGAAGRIRRLSIRVEEPLAVPLPAGLDPRGGPGPLTVLDTDQPARIRRGLASFEVPESEEGEDLVWLLRVVGSIRFWPDVLEEFAFTAAPRER